jgi:hypothetical protein
MNKRDIHTAINKGGKGPGAWLSLLQWLRLLVLSLARINHYKPDKAFNKPIQSFQNRILAENSTKTQTLTATKLTSMNPAHKYIKWSVLLLFAFMAKFTNAQTVPSPGPYPLTGNDNVCVGQTKNYGVTKVSGHSYSWSITPGTEGMDWNLTISDNTITVKWLKSGTYTISVIETNEYTCSSDAVQIQVFVHDLPVCSITGLDNICPGSTNAYNAPSGMSTYNWSITGDATISGANNGQTVSVVADNKCGSFTLTLVITNSNGCTSTCEKTFVITDTQAPTITGTIAPTPVEGCDVSAAPNAETTVAGLEIIGLSISDNCASDVNLIVSHNDVVSGTCELVITRTYTITDACGNATTAQHIINVKRPAFTITDAPGASTVSCLAAAVQPTTGLPVVKDACGNTLTPEVSAGADPQCEGTKVYTFTYKDCAGNTATWTYTYTITPVAPQITSCPANLVTCETEAGEYVIPTLTATDNCGKPLTITYIITGATERSGAGDASGAFGVGTSIIVWTVTNGCATTTCSTTVTINPLPNPVITGPDPTCVNTGTATYSVTKVGDCNTYEWNVSEGGTIIGSSTGNSIVVEWTTTGKKTVTVTETMCGTGCSKTVKKEITVNPKPTTTPITHD